MILPGLEKLDVYKLWENNFTGAPVNLAPAMEIFTCPTSVPALESAPSIAYAGNVGVGYVVGAQYRDDGVMMDTVGKAGAGGYAAMKNGVDYISSGDGASNTLLIAERSNATFNPQAFYDAAPRSAATAYSFAPNGGYDVGVNSTANLSPIIGFGAISKTPGSAFPTGGMIPSTSLKMINVTKGEAMAFPMVADATPSSRHPGTVVAAFCDGHVISLNDSMEPRVYCQLITPNTVGGAGVMMGGPSTQCVYGLPDAGKPLAEKDYQ
jgi:prepilin-type processing-associated H-X9-DG protein